MEFYKTKSNNYCIMFMPKKAQKENNKKMRIFFSNKIINWKRKFPRNFSNIGYAKHNHNYVSRLFMCTSKPTSVPTAPISTFTSGRHPVTEIYGGRIEFSR